MINHRNEMRAFALKALLAADGIPMSHEVLRDKLRARFGFIPMAELDVAIRSLEEDGYVCGALNAFDQSTAWGLSIKGRIQAQQLP